MRAFSDPVLTQLSRKLRDINFEPDDTLDHGAEALEKMHGVQLFPVNKKNPGAPREYAVVLHVAQKQRIIGKTKWRAAACRFADMARMKFFRYRQRNAVEPTDAELNFTVSQAKSDLQFESGAVALLNEIEAHFREKGWWKDQPEKEVRKAVNETLSRARYRDIDSRLAIVEEKLEGLVTLAQLHPDTFKQDPSILNYAPALCAKSGYEAFKRAFTGGSRFEADRKMVPFVVHVPDENGKTHHCVNIEVEARIENGQEILTPEAHAKIECVRTREVEHLQKLAKEFSTGIKQNTDPIAELLP